MSAEKLKLHTVEAPSTTNESVELDQLGVVVDLSLDPTLGGEQLPEGLELNPDTATILEQREFKNEIEPFTAEISKADRLFVGAVGNIAIGAELAGRASRTAGKHASEAVRKSIDIGIEVAGKVASKGFELAVKGFGKLKERIETNLTTQRGELFEQNIEKFAEPIQKRLAEAKAARATGDHETAATKQAAIESLVNLSAATPRGYRWAHKLGLMKNTSVNSEGLTNAYNSAIGEVRAFDQADIEAAEQAKAAGDQETYTQAVLKIRDNMAYNRELGAISDEDIATREQYVIERLAGVRTPDEVAQTETLLKRQASLLDLDRVDTLRAGIETELRVATAHGRLPSEEYEQLRAEVTARHLLNYLGEDQTADTRSKVIALMQHQRTARKATGHKPTKATSTTRPGSRRPNTGSGSKPTYRRLGATTS